MVDAAYPTPIEQGNLTWRDPRSSNFLGLAEIKPAKISPTYC